ncbi:stealth family protein [Kitasatospora sp. NPDC004289]
MFVRRSLTGPLRRPFAGFLGHRDPTAEQQATVPAPRSEDAAPDYAAVLAPTRTAEEERLLRSLPGIVRHTGQLAETVPGLPPTVRRDGNLAEVADVLAAAGVAHGIVPDGPEHHRLAIGPGDRTAVLAAVAGAFAGQAVYADLLEHGRTLATVPAALLPEAVAALETAASIPASEDGADAPSHAPETVDRVKGIRVYRPAVVGGRLYGADLGCDVEFWDSAAPSPGAIASIGQTPFGWWLPSLAADATTTIGGRDYPLVDAFAATFPDDIDFPVDVVVTWVDGSDPAWRERRDHARQAQGHRAPMADDGEQRYRSRDELRYCLRSIAAHAPWVRHVFLVTDDQVPAWLDTAAPGLTVVPHRELFAGTGAGPVFNSHAIETRLHTIDGLAEHFLYLNDDMLLGRPLTPQQFFLGSGVPRYFPDSRIIPPGEIASEDGDRGDAVYVAAQYTTRTALARATGRTYPHTLKHAPYPQRRSVLAETGERFAEALAATTASPFRSGSDLAPITLATHYAHATGRAVESQLVDGYFSIDSSEDLAQLEELHRHRWADVICLADTVRDHLPVEQQDRALADFLQTYFPAPSPYELPGAAAPDEAAQDADADAETGAREAAHV